MIPRLIIQPIEVDDEDEDELLKIVRTRSGYILNDSARAIDLNLGQRGTEATGKLFHYVADLVASGGKDLFARLCYEHAIDHIGISSPRIFHYLRGRIQDLDRDAAMQTTEGFYSSLEVQRGVGEMCLVMQLCPRRPKVKIPIIDSKTHRNDDWLRSVLRSPESLAVKKVYSPTADQRQMFHAANEMVAAIGSGELERAIFWFKWLLEEDAMVRKEFKGPGLSTLDRGPPGGKGKNNCGFFMSNVLAEAYKELAARGSIKMHEEAQTLLDLYRTADKRLTARRRTELLYTFLQMLTEVPRLRVQSAPQLVKDPIALTRAVDQMPLFFKEVLVYPPIVKSMPTSVSKAPPKRPKEKTAATVIDEKQAAYEEAMTRYMDRMR
jgi:hypothetical protein